MARGSAITVSCGEGNLGLLAGLLETRRADGAVTALELVNASGCVDELLFTGEERMASGADTDLDVVARGARTIRRAAGTGDHGVDVVGMNIGLHGCGKLPM